MFNRNRDDLKFLLTQVTISTDYSRLSNALDPERIARSPGLQQRFGWYAWPVLAADLYADEDESVTREVLQ
jgi:hypothetical protein